jgi:hypothetical protein
VWTAEWRWSVTLLSAALVISLVLVAGALLAAAAVLAGQPADETAVSALFGGAKSCATFAMTPFGVVVLANARTLSSGKAVTRWLIRVDIEVGILAIASSATHIHPRRLVRRWRTTGRDRGTPDRPLAAFLDTHAAAELRELRDPGRSEW